MNAAPHLIGVISDTHGLLRPEALDALTGAEMILHAGDIGKPEVLEKLSRIAPVTAVRGNNDTEAWAAELPETTNAKIDGTSIYILHDLKQLDIDPVESGYNIVVSGHSHQPMAVERGGVLYLNPGSAGPRRFSLPVSLALLRISDSRIDHEIVKL
jgi:putative phosphoesterase